MNPTLAMLLIGCLLYAAVLFYVFVVRRERDLGGLGKSGLLVLAGLLVPVIGFVLWHQSQSTARLAGLGFKPYPGFKHSVGVATGMGEAPTWVYAVDDETAVLEFYKKREHHTAWKLTSENSSMLVFVNGDDELTLSVGNGAAVLMLKKRAD